MQNLNFGIHSSSIRQKYVLDDIVAEYASLSIANPIAGAFSLRRLRGDFSGAVCRIKNTSNNSEGNVKLNGDKVSLNSDVIILVKGSSSFNVLDTVSLSTFLGGASATLIAFYDQSGKGRFLDSKNASYSYPSFATSGALFSTNGIPTVKGSSSHIYGSVGTRNVATISVFALIKKSSSDSTFCRYISTSSGVGQDFGFTGLFNLNTTGSANSIATERNGTYSPVKTLVNNEVSVLSLVWDNTNHSIRKNNDTAGTVASTGNFNFDNIGILGSNGGGNLVSGEMGDLILFDVALSVTNRQNLEREIGKAYGITVA